MAEVLVALYDADTYGRFDEAMADQACPKTSVLLCSHLELVIRCEPGRHDV